MLEFDDSWRFGSPGAVPEAAVREIFSFAKRSSHGDRGWSILETFKIYFARSAGTSYDRSSGPGWAATDLWSLMFDAATNAPLFIEAFLEACEDVHALGAPVASVPDVNRVLRQHGTGFQVDPPKIIRAPVGVEPVAVSAPTVSERTNALIQRSLQNSETLLNDGNYRQAVQEVLWLMETVATAFKGMATSSGSVEGKYFSQIVHDLRRIHKGGALEQVLGWAMRLYGYLSSPTGGGIRHGTDIADPADIEEHEARLFCDLIRTYIQYLLAAHERVGDEGLDES